MPLSADERQNFDKLHLRFGTQGEQCVGLPDTLIIHHDHIGAGAKGRRAPRKSRLRLSQTLLSGLLE